MQRRRLAVLGIAVGVGLAGLLLHRAPQAEPREGPPQRLAALDGLRPLQWLSNTTLLVERDTIVASPTPTVPRWPHDTGTTAAQPLWIGTTREGHPLFATPDSSELIALGTTERKVPLSLPNGLSFATAPNICGEFFVSDGPHLTPESDAVLAVLQSTDAPEAHPLTFWRLPLSGGAAQKLATLPSERHGLGAVRLSPDKKHLLYWVEKRAYTKALGER